MKVLMLVGGLLFAATPCFAQKPKVVEGTFQASGKCSMCKDRIERALSVKEVKSAKWDKSTKMVTVEYISGKITLDSLQHRVALVGHDTEKFKASDALYAELPSCCLYRGKK